MWLCQPSDMSLQSHRAYSSGGARVQFASSGALAPPWALGGHGCPAWSLSGCRVWLCWCQCPLWPCVFLAVARASSVSSGELRGLDRRARVASGRQCDPPGAAQTGYGHYCAVGPLGAVVGPGLGRNLGFALGPALATIIWIVCGSGGIRAGLLLAVTGCGALLVAIVRSTPHRITSLPARAPKAVQEEHDTQMLVK